MRSLLSMNKQTLMKNLQQICRLKVDVKQGESVEFQSFHNTTDIFHQLWRNSYRDIS